MLFFTQYSSVENTQSPIREHAALAVQQKPSIGRPPSPPKRRAHRGAERTRSPPFDAMCIDMMPKTVSVTPSENKPFKIVDMANLPSRDFCDKKKASTVPRQQFKVGRSLRLGKKYKRKRCSSSVEEENAATRRQSFPTCDRERRFRSVMTPIP